MNKSHEEFNKHRVATLSRHLILLVFVLIVATCRISAQSCNCNEELAFIRAHMEKNHPGFNSVIKDPQQPAYKAFVTALEKKIANDPSSKYCLAYLKQYMNYLKDHHIRISGPALPVNEDSVAAVTAFLNSPAFRATERISIDSAKTISYLKTLKDPGLEGIYRTADGTYTVALLKKPSERRDYAAIILSSTSKLWQPGQVKFEVKEINDTVYDIFSYQRNHSLNYEQVPMDPASPEIPNWIKTFPATTARNQEVLPTSFFTFRILDSLTTYIAINTFSGRLNVAFDSAYKAVMPEIVKRPNLIIDVRNNGGGSDRNYKALMPLIYTDPIENDIVDYYATADNIKAYEDLRDLYRSKPEVYGKNGAASWEYGIMKMRSTELNTFVPMGSGQPSQTTYTPVKGYPEKVAIIYNRNSASSCEAFLFEARVSKKVITVGENSGGYTGYGNLMTTMTPCGNRLEWTTTRYRNQLQYDFKGIPPMYRVPKGESNWVEYTRRLLQ